MLCDYCGGDDVQLRNDGHGNFSCGRCRGLIEKGIDEGMRLATARIVADIKTQIRNGCQCPECSRADYTAKFLADRYENGAHLKQEK